MTVEVGGNECAVKCKSKQVTASESMSFAFCKLRIEQCRHIGTRRCTIAPEQVKRALNQLGARDSCVLVRRNSEGGVQFGGTVDHRPAAHGVEVRPRCNRPQKSTHLLSLQDAAQVRKYARVVVAEDRIARSRRLQYQSVCQMLLQPACRLAAFDNGANDRRQAILQVRLGAFSQRWQLQLGMLGTVQHGSHAFEFGTGRGNQLTDFIDRRHASR
ncbi:hypothetical protein WT53_25585 [Burkholderia sp. MSMB2157WGS]|nr:hypothetical protein WT53_25585 [Burkholderia sp. MSMB2157WGS]